MGPSKLQRQQLLQDLQKMYRDALTDQDYPVALRAIELLGRELGLFTKISRSNKPKDEFSFEALTDEQLEALIRTAHAKLSSFSQE